MRLIVGLPSICYLFFSIFKCLYQHLGNYHVVPSFFEVEILHMYREVYA